MMTLVVVEMISYLIIVWFAISTSHLVFVDAVKKKRKKRKRKLIHISVDGIKLCALTV